MCGRYANARRDADLIRAFDVEDVVGEELPPSWNIAPTRDVRVVLERAPKQEPEAQPVRQLRTARWGLVPSWAEDLSIGSRLINARSETITEKSSFKTAAAKRRCIVPADGYFEWQKLPDGKKQPFFLHGPDGEPLAFAGLYELWPDPSLPPDHPDRWRWTSTIMTTRAADTLGHIHDRTPVIVPADLIGDWLDPEVTDLRDVRQMVDAMPSPVLTPRPVGKAVGNVNNDGPELIEPVEP
ncbi:SOS response-associated peptidase [Georgenia sp. AZ-5]|uniref:SOS response-associated peptidase n=1 Tax=Georgenia sp. AZ-5 TaxID=3367526 RepID=UPI003754DBF5